MFAEKFKKCAENLNKFVSFFLKTSAMNILCPSLGVNTPLKALYKVKIGENCTKTASFHIENSAGRRFFKARVIKNFLLI